jgi:FkbM family methyltransferase
MILSVFESLIRRVILPITPKSKRLALKFWSATRIGKYEQEVLQLERLLSDCRGVAIDVGANVGYWSHALAKTGYFERVLAFEPNYELTQDLRNAGLSCVEIHNFALSDRASTALLHIPTADGVRISGWSSLEDSIDCTYDRLEELEVQTKTIDGLGLKKLAFIKIDVEGHELSVLAGARQTIAQCRPYCVIEVRQRHLDEVNDYFRRLGVGYRRVDVLAELGMSLTGENVMYSAS